MIETNDEPATPRIVAEMQADTCEPYSSWGHLIPWVTRSDHPRFGVGTRLDWGFVQVALDEGYKVEIGPARPAGINAPNLREPNVEDLLAEEHETTPVQVWVDVDKGIADTVTFLNTLPGVRTFASCQGVIDGRTPYVMAWWPPEHDEFIRSRFTVNDADGVVGSYYVSPKKGA